MHLLRTVFCMTCSCVCLKALLLGRYPTTVATLSRRARDVIEEAFEKSADGGRDHPLVGSRLHDFGMRGCTGKTANWIQVLLRRMTQKLTIQR